MYKCNLIGVIAGFVCRVVHIRILKIETKYAQKMYISAVRLLSAAVYKVHDYHIALQPIAVGMTLNAPIHHFITSLPLRVNSSHFGYPIWYITRFKLHVVK